MKTLLLILISVILSLSFTANANTSKFNYQRFVNTYFTAMINTQKPDASKDDLEQYLSFLTDDIGFQHYPNAPDDTREPNGKQLMRKGMTHYLGVHSEYKAKLLDYMIGFNSIVIKYKFSAKGIRGDGLRFNYEKEALDVLELKNGKVAIIRRYSK